MTLLKCGIQHLLFRNSPKHFIFSRTAGTVECENTVASKNKLLRYLRNKIEATGPITVAEYMKEVLINPYSGYYMHRDVFGSMGDFITSPEISQMFGELIAIWFYNEWTRLRQPEPVQLVEFGPGRGTLTEDILRVFSRLNVNTNLSVHLIEVSQHLSKLQQEKLCPKNERDIASASSQSSSSHESLNNNIYDRTIISKYGFPVSWHHDLMNIPNAFSLFLAHEFFDALPIHKFRKVKDQWREVLVDFKEESEGAEGGLQFVLARDETPASKICIDPDEKRNEVEVSLESCLLMNQMATRLKEDGGISLIIDYGYTNAEKTDTFRSFHKHKLHDPLVEPGTADLTADVDFAYLIKCAQDKACAVGPITQAKFLKNMGIEERLAQLLKRCPEQHEYLKSGYHMLTDVDKMGERFKFLALFPAVLKDVICKVPIAGFS